MEALRPVILCAILLPVTALPARDILVFGGNGFIGSSTVEKLIEAGDNVTIVNRGNWYWDSATRIRPNVTWIKCDRSQKLEKCGSLSKLLEGVKWDAVLDFSCYGKFEMQEATTFLKDKTGRYVYISTDSVYDVCKRTHTGKTIEKEAIRPEDIADRNTQNEHHPYGHRKLQAEEVLYSQRWDNGFPFVIFRLPDVVGPRDATSRWWLYQLWIKVARDLDCPVVLPTFLEDYELSLVFVDDVAEAIVKVLNMGPHINDQAINLAYQETFTLRKLLHDIAAELDVTDLYVKIEESKQNPVYLYPSVRTGPVEVSKAENLLSWETSPWKFVVSQTVAFYENAMTDEKYATQKDEIIQMLENQKCFVDKKEKLYDTLEELYSIELHHFRPMKDEL